MYIRLIEGFLNYEFVAGVQHFFEFCMKTGYYEKYGQKLRCPCRKCDNRKITPVSDLKKHLDSRGFVPNYYHWVYQGETKEMFDAVVQESRQYEGSSSNVDVAVYIEENQFGQMYQMIMDGARYGDEINREREDEEQTFVEEEMNLEARKILSLIHI